MKTALTAMEVGRAGEHLVCSDLIIAGYRAVLVGQGFPYDVLIEADRKLIRIQVKTSLVPRNVSSKNRPPRTAYSFSVVRRSGDEKRRVLIADCDIIALVAMDIRKIAYFPVRLAMQTMQLSLPGDTTGDGRGKGRLGAIDGFPIDAALQDDRSVYEHRQRFCKSGHAKTGYRCHECRRIRERARLRARTAEAQRKIGAAA